MRILVFSPVDIFAQWTTSHNGGGWICGYCSKLSAKPEIALGICYVGSGNWASSINGINIFPISTPKGLQYKAKHLLDYSLENDSAIAGAKKAIEEFHPNVIHIFGSENPFGLICSQTDIPSVIHLQGFLPSYDNAKYPPNCNYKDFLPNKWLHPLRWAIRRHTNKVFTYRAKRELAILQQCKNFFGRTKWDKAIVELFAPKAAYWYCSEFLRNCFYEYAQSWKNSKREEIKIVSILSTPTYKGHDLVLKTAQLLKDYLKLKFEWHIFGIGDMSAYENLLGIKAKDNSVILRGTVAADTLVKELLSSRIYVHPSYIDNSPNSLCEAQMLGVPCIAVNTGGVSSIIDDPKSGILVPANDPVMMASEIATLLKNRDMAASIGKAGAITAMARHDRSKMLTDILNCYQTLITNSKK